MGAKLGIFLIRMVALLPLSWARLLGRALGWVLYAVVPGRRRVVLVNLAVCFPEWTEDERRSCCLRTFERFAQSWLDRGWLWHGSAATVRQRLHIEGSAQRLDSGQPTVLFAPHFLGLDAAWTALTQQIDRPFTTIYTDQANKTADAWILAGRKRFGSGRLFGRSDGVQEIVSSLRSGDPLYLLPDMNFGVEESLFVPFFDVPAATVPSLSRFARLGRAKVMPVIARMTAHGYTISLGPVWDDVPSRDLQADTALMNRRLEEWIRTMPDQYYWVHKRFKSRPPGLPDLY